MIQLVNITKTFTATREVRAVRDVSLSIEAGAIFGIIGFSGAGKSTLVRCINLLERPDAGQVLVDGQDLTRLSEPELRQARKKIGMIFQHFNLFRSRNVWSNIAFPLKYSGMKKEDVAARVQELLELVGLSDKASSYPSQLSGGQKQRVGIARALASNPSVLLCDEATSALDPQTTQSILALLRELNKKLKITIVIITHEMQVIKTICSHAAVMDDGVIVEQGTIFDIFSTPKAKITKEFIATTSHLNKVYDLLADESPVVRLSPSQSLCYFRYTGRNTVDALISTASIMFNVKLNIVFGDLDIIQETPLGGLIIILDGDSNSVNKTIEWFTEKGVTVEELKHG
jgi:D-methionine transport system ATP-binding protein